MLRYCLLVFLLTGCFKEQKNLSEPHYFFIVHARMGEYLEVKNQLLLSNLDRMVGFFTTDPSQHSGAIALDEFLGEWSEHSDAFEKNPPNAAIASLTAAGDYHEVNVELTNPLFSEGVLSFDVSLLPGSSWEGLTKLGEVMIFIDAQGELIVQTPY